MDDAPIIFELGGVAVEVGEISTTESEYTADIEITSATGNLRIYTLANNTATWYIYTVAIRCISLDLNATAANVIMVGDRLKVGTEAMLVTEVNTDKVTVETAYNGTTAADHAADADVSSNRAIFQQLSPSSIATGPPAFITKDYDFDEPSFVKKVYKIYITYANSAGSDLVNKIKVAADGNTTFAQTSISTPHSASTYVLTGTFSASQSSWNVAVFSFDSPFPCQSIALYFNDGGVANGISINDISFEYRTIHKRVS